MIKFEDKTVFFTSQPIVFNFEVGDVIETPELVIVRLNIPADNQTRQNVFALKKDGKFVWQVESSLKKYPEINVELPYENMTLLEDNKLIVSDFFGRTFDVNVTNGKLLNFKVTR